MKANATKYPCPMCLFSSGVLADGKGTVCNICGGTGKVSKGVLDNFNKKMEIKPNPGKNSTIPPK